MTAASAVNERGSGAVRQRAAAVLMIRPAHFFVDPETASTNHLQSASAAASGDILAEARREFDRLSGKLDAAGVRVCIREAATEPQLPDAVFPNNWISMHADGTVVLYPMLPRLRRLERDRRIVAALEHDFGFAVRHIVDLSGLEARGEIVEGTGSLILDHLNRVGYAALSARTTSEAVKLACQAIGYRPVIFDATHESGSAIYHTNVMLSIGTRFAVICLASIRDVKERDRVRSSLESTGREIVDLTETQMLSFAANCLEVDARGEPLLALSQRAWKSLRSEQQKALERMAGICAVPIETIEKVGGGGVRCMLAEIFLPAAAGVSERAS